MTFRVSPPPGGGPFGKKVFRGMLAGCGLLVLVGAGMARAGDGVAALGTSLATLGAVGLASAAVGLLIERRLRRGGRDGSNGGRRRPGAH